MVCGHCLVALSLTINETLKWLPSLPTLMQKSFWWWQFSDRYIISLFPHLHTPSHILPVPNNHCGLYGRRGTFKEDEEEEEESEAKSLL